MPGLVLGWMGWTGGVAELACKGSVQSVSARNGPISMPYLGISSGAILDPTLDAKRDVLEF